MTEEQLVSLYPRRWHMAHDGTWPALRAHGLNSAAALLDDYGVQGERRERLLSFRRRECELIEACGLPGAVLRDQRPIEDARLAACLLDGMLPREGMNC